MEDLNDNLPTKGKRYYMSHAEYVFTEKHRNKLKELIDKPFDFNKRMELSQLVCATNMELARKAVINTLESSGEFIILKCIIDNLVVGD